MAQRARHSRGAGVAHGSPDAPATVPSGTWHRLPTLVLATSLAVLALLLALVLANGRGPLAIDAAALEGALSLRTDGMTSVMLQITSIIMPAVLVMCAVSLSVPGHGPRPLVASALCVGGAAGLNLVVKRLVARPRPPETLRLAVETSTSFPSGHAVTAMAFYGFLIWLVWHYQRPDLWRGVLVAILALAIALVGLSRVYLAVHYLTDIVGGFCFALAWLAVYTRHVAPRVLAARD